MPSDTLDFVIAAPPQWMTFDLLRPDTRDALPAPLTHALSTAEHGRGEAQLLMLQSLVAVTADREPLAAGLAVTLAAPAAPVSSAPLSADAFAGADVSAIKLAAGSGVRVRGFFATTVGQLPVEGLRVQYLLHTGHGLLTITLTTPQAAETEDWERLFDAIAATAELR